MSLELRLADLPVLRIDNIQFAGAKEILQEIAARNVAKAKKEAVSRQLKKSKEQMKRRLMERGKNESFEQATDVLGRERILLSLYLEYAARSDASWLPSFDNAIASSVLGSDGREWHAGRRRQATLLFFTHFDRLSTSGLSHLCALLVDAYDSMESEGQGPVGLWRHHRKLLFSPPGHQSVARSAGANETLPSLMERFAIPSEGRFAECLRQVFLLNAVRESPLGKVVPELAEIEAIKTERASVSQPMGAAALQIMVQRVAKEGGRKWSGEWPEWIAKLGCDPRHGRATAEGAKWWGWATDDELRLAQQGITRLTIRFFVEFLRQSLEGETGESQFKKRAKFLEGLEEAQKINDARIIVSEPLYLRIQPTLRSSASVARFQDGGQEAKAIICLSCVDDVFIIEGTHNFGLRAFNKRFPLAEFWTLPRRVYKRSDLVVPQAQCPIFLTHGQRGGWVSDFFFQLRSRFHVEWSDVRN